MEELCQLVPCVPAGFSRSHMFCRWSFASFDSVGVLPIHSGLGRVPRLGTGKSSSHRKRQLSLVWLSGRFGCGLSVKHQRRSLDLSAYFVVSLCPKLGAFRSFQSCLRLRRDEFREGESSSRPCLHLGRIRLGEVSWKGQIRTPEEESLRQRAKALCGQVYSLTYL